MELSKNEIRVVISDFEILKRPTLVDQQDFVLGKLQAAGIQVTGRNFVVKEGIIELALDEYSRDMIFVWKSDAKARTT